MILKSKKMKKTMPYSFDAKCLLLITVCLLLLNCDLDVSEDVKKYINYDIRGTWERYIAALWSEGQTIIAEKEKLYLGMNPSFLLVRWHIYRALPETLFLKHTPRITKFISKTEAYGKVPFLLFYGNPTMGKSGQ